MEINLWNRLYVRFNCIIDQDVIEAIMQLVRWACVAAIVILLSQSLPDRGFADTAPLTIVTGDGLSMSLAENGTICSLAIDGVDLPRPIKGPVRSGFFLGEIRGSYADLSDNLILNAGFESWDGLADDWNAYSSGYSKGAEAHGGSSSLKASATATSIVAGGYQVVRFGESQANYRTLKVSG
ncbi:hypothetical protein FDZ71_18350, partial [bacterium]